jgi:hypothetical protein
MPALFLYPAVGAKELATLIKAGVANATVHLIKVPAPSLGDATVLADLTPAEATVDGYAAATVVAWTGPYQDPAGGSSIRSGEIDFSYTPAAPPVVDTNQIAGFWVQTAGGILLCVVLFDTPVVLGVTNVLLPLTVVLNYGRTA